MSIAKSVVTGTVHRAPEKRFTQNNIAVSAFVLDIGDFDFVTICKQGAKNCQRN